MAKTGSSLQISPGELSKAHRELSGPTHCVDCHDTGKRPPEFLCLKCHREIAVRLETKRGLHASMLKSERSSRSCIRCHSDHNGRNFELIHWEFPLSQFDHATAGYRLEGRHAQIQCEKCHQPAHISQSSARAIAIKDLSRTYLGLSGECISCHEDGHRGQLSLQCERCHAPDTWKNLRRFNHSQSRFPLDSTHEKVDCGKCHKVPATADGIVRYAGIPFEDCTPCHMDPHGNAFLRPCRECHRALDGWKPSGTATAFDHSTTRYPLSGKHSGLRCNACHSNGKFNVPVAFAQCTDCHKKNPHSGQFTTRLKGGACDGCHSVQGFKPTTFDSMKHDATQFPLRERHAKLQCNECHKPEPAGIVYKIRVFSCIACHQDIHYSQFALQPFENQCDRCHTQTAFKPSTYTVVQHSGSRFTLNGAHSTVSCDQCHLPDPKPVKFRFEDQSCTACHKDPHKAQFADRMNSGFPDGTRAGCRICHTVNAWKDLASFDHASTQFFLEGAHRDAPCEKCHKPENQNGGVHYIQYSAASRSCSGCHEDPHGGQFTTRMSQQATGGNPIGCAGCHNTTGWKKLSGFDHAATSFPLKGAHQGVACEKCHTPDVSQETAKIIRYASTPRQCGGCHEDVHEGQFSKNPDHGDCAACHQVVKWVPSFFDHDRQSSYKLEGAHRRAACGLCHVHAIQVRGRKVILYKQTARECSACHVSDTSESEP